MMSKKNRVVVPGSRKARCSSVGQYQNREVGRGRWGNRGREKDLWNFRRVGSQEPGKGKSFEV